MPSDSFYVNIYLLSALKVWVFFRRLQTSVLAQNQDNTTMMKTYVLLMFIFSNIFQKPTLIFESLLWICQQLFNFIQKIKATFEKTIHLNDLDICISKVTLKQYEVRLHQNHCCLFLFLFLLSICGLFVSKSITQTLNCLLISFILLTHKHILPLLCVNGTGSQQESDREGSLDPQPPPQYTH